MNAASQDHPEPNDEPVDAQLAVLVDAILDGAAVDWSACSHGVSASFEEELRIVAGVADVHRSLDTFPATVDASTFPPQLPWQTGHLTITSSLGKGVYGEVFKAWDTQLHRDVAVKLLFRDGGQAKDDASFLEEGRLLARVRHPHVVTVFGADRLDGRVALLTEYVEGRSLAAVVAEGGPMSAGRVVAIGIDLCQALQAVHRAGLLHRDIKAQNVMQETSGRIVLMDFGAGARAAEATTSGLAGTPLYLAPELWAGAEASERTDVYSLGVLLFFLSTGDFPVKGRTTAEIRDELRRGHRRSLTQARPYLPRDFAAAIERAITLAPEERYATAGEFEQALRRVSDRRSAGGVVLRYAGIAAAAVGAVSVSYLAISAGRGDFSSSPPSPPLPPTVVTAGSATMPAATLALQDLQPPPTLAADSLPAADVASDRVGRVAVPNYVALGTPSRDGRYLPYVDAQRGEAWLLELATERAERLFERPIPGPTVEAVALSSDAGRLAYVYVSRSPQWSELRIRPLERTWPKTAVPLATPPEVVVHNEPGFATILPVEWTRDGTELLYWVLRLDGSASLSLFRLGSGESIMLRTFAGHRPRRASLSPDGQFVVYDMPTQLPSPNRDILIAPTAPGGKVDVLVGGSADDALPIWMPDGGSVFFSSNRRGRTEGWTVAVSGGRAAGRPVRMAGGLAGVAPLAITDTGTFYYTLQTAIPDLHRVTLDQDGNSSGDMGPLLPRSEDGRQGGRWSGDGRYLAYVVVRGMTQLERGGTFIRIHDGTTGAVRDIAPQVNYLGGTMRWSPDGKQLLVLARGFDNLWGLHRVDVRTGATVAVVRDAQPNVQQTDRAFDWSRPGTIVYVHMTRGLIEHDINTGAERVLVPATEATITSFGFSPDGSNLAFSTDTREGENRTSTLSIRSSDGTTRVLQSITDGGVCVFQAWAPDGQYVNFSRRRPNELPGLWRIDVSRGTPVDLHVTLDAPAAMYFPALRPDGRELLYGVKRAGFELWRFDDFTDRR